MNYKKNSLYIENISIQRIAKKFGTPAYCYSLNKLKLNIRNFIKYFRSINPLLCFSVKSNSNFQILKEINKMGMGADVVSKGELIMALKSGISPKKIVFSGVGKTFDELKFAIDKNMDINIGIYDVNGRLIEELVDSNFTRGIYSINWDASVYPSGIYFVKIVSENISSSQKLILMK